MKERKSEYLVAIRPEVLSDAEHALGNLFQRIHHATRLARESQGVQAERLTSAIEDIEGLLELVFDYVSPVEVELRRLNCGRVAESLVAQVRPHALTEIAVRPFPASHVMADPRVLSRSFHLIGRARTREIKAAPQVAVNVTLDGSLGQAEFLVSADGATLSNGIAGQAAEEGLAWQVAARLIELQGGELRQVASEDALRCSVTLPLAE